ncbi:hypothetical protein NDU88_002576 [Pleurodeles waltl]|uniref:Uncharacterized protein n=1 Tax=Pleurodeles waltl TaxID=8319 RepID=A0AAV7SDK8_PLEWA|nr:hypothetical protein NDU88_002576 [Pleurodeles waltl]
MFESPRGTHKNLSEASRKECAYITQSSLTQRKAGSKKEDGVAEKERREPEDGSEEDAGVLQEERREERVDPGKPIGRKARAEQASLEKLGEWESQPRPWRDVALTGT